MLAAASACSSREPPPPSPSSSTGTPPAVDEPPGTRPPPTKTATTDPVAPATTDPTPSTPPAVEDAGSASAAAPSATADAGVPWRPSFGVDVAATLERLRTASPSGFRAIGTTSLTFRVTFTDGSRCAFKPRRTPGIDGWKAEIAAYRLSRLLQIENVPPTIGRRFRRRDVESMLRGAIGDERADAELTRIVWERNGEVRGAAIFWVQGLQPSNLDGRDGMGRWQRQLRHGGGLPEADRPLFAQLSDLLVFDYLIANADRWSGANVGLDGTGRVLVFRDNDSGFPDSVNATRHERVLRRLQHAERFSRHMVERLRAISREDVVRVMAEDPEGEMLSARQIDQLMERREAVLTYVQSLIRANGEAATLYF